MKKFTILIFVFFVLASLTNSYSQDNNTVTITVSGNGNTKQEALQTALRNAIEQAFGTFISSNTTILNDELVKDEIVSVSNGNIQKYEVLAEIQTPDSIWNNTVKASVSVDKLTSFCESKGVNVEFKGSLFALNVKQQILNEENEIASIKNMCSVLKEISKNSFDYEILTDEPTSLGSNNSWKIPVSITAKTNANFKLISDYFKSTLNGLTLTVEEVDNYSKLEKDYITVGFCPLGYKPQLKKKRGKKTETNNNSPQIFYLRNKKSLDELYDYITFFRKAILNFAVVNEVKSLQGDVLRTNYYLELKSSNFHPVYSKKGAGGYGKYKILVGQKSSSRNYSFETYCKLNDLQFGNPKYSNDSKYFPFLAEINPNSLLGKYGQFDIVISFWLFESGYTAAVFSYDDKLSLEQLGRISGYKIIHRVGGSELDQEGHLFSTVWIGNQRWMAQDLTVESFSDGTPIKKLQIGNNTFAPDDWKESTEPLLGIVGRDTYVYNAYVMELNHNVCPKGWHVPIEGEWKILEDYLGGKDVAGDKLKITKGRYFISGYEKNEREFDNTATNTSGFSARLSDYIMGGVSGVIMHNTTSYWSSSKTGSGNYYYKRLEENKSELSTGFANFNYGIPIRCIQD